MSIPEIQVDLDYANRSSSVTKEITSPSGEKIKFKVKFTGGLFKEWKKAKLMVDPHTPVTPPQSSLTSTNHANMNDLYDIYKSSIPWSERLYYWLRAKRHKSKILNKMFTI